MVSLGDEEPYQTNSLSDEEALYEEFRSGDCAYGTDMIKYGNGLLSNKLTNKNHTVKTMVQTVNKNCLSSYHSSSVDTTTNKTAFAVQHVTKVRKESKTALEINKYNELWIIDSGASHHITNKLSDYTSYMPYAIPEEVQTANKHDSLTILGEGTVFFDTETTNRQIHRVCLENVCYIPNGSNRLLSRGQLCDTGLIERADNKSTIFSLPTGHIFLIDI